MASEALVRQYLAYWFQLGKGVVVHKGQEVMLPHPVIEGDHYSSAFERCWEQLCQADAGDCYLEGTSQTIRDLLSPSWEILPCARCTMPVPIRDAGIGSPECPCTDLPTWPNLELPLPRSPVNSQMVLTNIRARLVEQDQTK